MIIVKSKIANSREQANRSFSFTEARKLPSKRKKILPSKPCRAFDKYVLYIHHSLLYSSVEAALSAV